MRLPPVFFNHLTMDDVLAATDHVVIFFSPSTSSFYSWSSRTFWIPLGVPAARRKQPHKPFELLMFSLVVQHVCFWLLLMQIDQNLDFPSSYHHCWHSRLFRWAMYIGKGYLFEASLVLLLDLVALASLTFSAYIKFFVQRVYSIRGKSGREKTKLMQSPMLTVSLRRKLPPASWTAVTHHVCCCTGGLAKEDAN